MKRRWGRRRRLRCRRHGILKCGVIPALPLCHVQDYGETESTAAGHEEVLGFQSNESKCSQTCPEAELHLPLPSRRCEYGQEPFHVLWETRYFLWAPSSQCSKTTATPSLVLLPLHSRLRLRIRLHQLLLLCSKLHLENWTPDQQEVSRGYGLRGCIAGSVGSGMLFPLSAWAWASNFYNFKILPSFWSNTDYLKVFFKFKA